MRYNKKLHHEGRQQRQGRKVDLVFRHTRADDKIRIDPKMWIRPQSVDILLKVDYNIN